MLCVFAGQEQLVALVEVFLDQHLLLAAAGVDPREGLEGHYVRLGRTLQIGTGDYFRQQVKDVIAAHQALDERKRELDAREQELNAVRVAAVPVASVAVQVQQGSPTRSRSRSPIERPGDACSSPPRARCPTRRAPTRACASSRSRSPLRVTSLDVSPPRRRCPVRRAPTRSWTSPSTPDASGPESVPGDFVPRPDSVAEAKECSPVPGPSTPDASGPESVPGDTVPRPDSVAEAMECFPAPGPSTPDASGPESVPGDFVPRPDSVAEAKECSPVPGPSTPDASGPESVPGDTVPRPDSVAEAKECSPVPGCSSAPSPAPPPASSASSPSPSPALLQLREHNARLIRLLFRKKACSHGTVDPSPPVRLPCAVSGTPDHATSGASGHSRSRSLQDTPRRPKSILRVPGSSTAVQRRRVRFASIVECKYFRK